MAPVKNDTSFADTWYQVTFLSLSLDAMTRLREILAAKGWKPADLIRELAGNDSHDAFVAAHSAVARWIKDGDMLLSNAVRLADVLGVTLDELAGRSTPAASAVEAASGVEAATEAATAPRKPRGSPRPRSRSRGERPTSA